MREFLEDMPSTEMMINNMMGPVGFYELSEDHIEVIRVNEPYYNLFGSGASKSITIIREHTSPEDYVYIKDLLKQAEDLDGKAKERLELYLLAQPLVECINNYLGDFFDKTLQEWAEEEDE